jgi:signal transduction histidine kinase
VRRTYLVLAAGTILLIGATYLILRALVLRPVERLEEASEAVAEGRPPPEVPVPRGGGEMAMLIANFNRMAKEVHEYQEHLEDRVLDTLERVTATERRLVVAQRLAATGALAAGFAHEINNPLGGILNAVRKLRAGDLSAERREEYFDLVQDGVDRIRTIVERILHFTPHEREPAPVDVAEACRRAVALATHRAEEQGVKLALEVSEPLDGIIGDAQELTQAILNLLLNAIDAIPEGARGAVSLRAGVVGDEVRIDVADTGVGMEEEIRRRCVDLFFSTKPEGEGTGLGLGIVQHIVIDHGGSLEIESEPGVGTTVTMRLPLGMDK